MEEPQNQPKTGIVSRELSSDASPIDFIQNAMTPQHRVVDEPIEKKEINREVLEDTPIDAKPVETPKADEKIPFEDVKTGVKPEEKVIEEVTPESYKAKIKANPIPVFAKYAAESGVLPKDFEIKDDLTFQELNEAFWKNNEDKYVSIAKNDLLEQRIKSGITPEIEERAKRLSGGVTEEEITEYDVVNHLASYEIDSKSDDSEVREYLTYWYNLKGLPENKVSSNIEQDLADKRNLDTIIGAAKADFEYESNRLDKIQQDKIELANSNRLKSEQDYKDNILRTLKSCKIADAVYTPDQMKTVENALFVQSEIYEDEDGRSWKVTPYRKKVLETKRDPQLRLKQKVDFILGLVTDSVDNRKTEKKTITEFVKGLSDLIDVEINPSTPTSNTSGTGIVRREL